MKILRPVVAHSIMAAAVVLGISTANASFFKEYFVDPDDGNVDASRFLTDVPYGFLPVPHIITEPAVGNGLGLGGVLFHESDEQKKTRTQSGKAILPPNVSFIGVAGTDNGTRAAGLGQLGFWRGDTLRYKGFLLYPSVNMDFYSLGGVNLPRPIELNVEGPTIVQDLSKRLGKSNWFIAVHQIYRSSETSLVAAEDREGINLPAAERFIDNHTGQSVVNSGVGLRIEYDSVKNPFNPANGYNYHAQVLTFDDAIGSDIEYKAYNFTGLNYWDLPGRFDLSLRIQYDGVEATDDERLPAYIPPYIDLRGIPVSRYQGNNVVVAEMEVGWHINERWRISAFTGTGRAASHFSDLSDAESESTYGTGFRYLIAKRYGFTMGIDIARGPEETAFYIQAGSTWR